ncbi:MAG: 23S rRNA (adenine(2503)-C(2))-methyltransferase RlmN [Treponema sp.]|nr:23S rRNA (adenine(2503)-C(2))-methyltransferase RlmN [Treponema sp.]
MNNGQLSGLSPDELADIIAPLPRFRAVQIFKWIACGVSGFYEMSNLPLSLREDLSNRFSLRPDIVETIHPGADGTVKLALRFSDGAVIEAVLLSDSKQRTRYTACLSTQAGCPSGCVFCKTGSLGFLRNLTSAEIVEQLLRLGTIAKEQSSGAQPVPIANIVVMGMGEPLLNLTELRRALNIITCGEGLNISGRRITVSTCGIADGIIDIADNGPAIRLALSLTAADEDLRRQLMPITANQPLSRVKEALRYFQERGGTSPRGGSPLRGGSPPKGGGRVTLEMVLLSGINTRSKDAQALAQFAQGLDVVVNLIPWNPVKGLMFDGKPLREPSAAETASFARRLEALSLKVTRRFRRGRGVMGACGQLGCTANPDQPAW